MDFLGPREVRTKMTLLSFLSAVHGDLQGHVMWTGEVPRVEVARCKAAPCGGCLLQGGPTVVCGGLWLYGFPCCHCQRVFCVRTSGVRLLTGEERERERVLSVTWLRPCGVRVVKQLGLSVVAWSSLVGSPGVVVVALVVWREIVSSV